MFIGCITEINILELDKADNFKCMPIYIPSREIISFPTQFRSLYDDYYINMDSTYYDLARLLLRPEKKEIPDELQEIVNLLENYIEGKVIQKNNQFFLQDGRLELEMNLVSEDYCKIAELVYLNQLEIPLALDDGMDDKCKHEE